MERIVEQSEKDALTALSSVKAKALFKYVLSPVEKAAVECSFNSFQFNFNGTEIYISARNSRRFLFIIKSKLDLLTFVESKEQKSGNIPLNLREIFDDPAEILNLPAQTRNLLCAIGCYTMYAAMQLGRTYFKNLPGFGRRSLETLDVLFAKYNVPHLFK